MSVQLNVRVDDDLAQRVRMRAAELGCLPRDVVEEAVRAHLTAGARSTVVPASALIATADLPRPAGSAHDGDARRTGDAVVMSAEAEGRGCPNCGGDMLRAADRDVLVCGECQTTLEVGA